jgi:hypothetical protein
MTRFLPAFAILLVTHEAASAQSLADLAKKEAERRKAVAAPAKVITDKDIAPIQAATPKQAEPKPSTATTPTQPATAQPDGEGVWKERMRVLQLRLDKQITEGNSIADNVDSLSDVLDGARGVAGVPVTEELLRNTTALRMASAAAENTRREIANLREEARRAGVPPGWLRQPETYLNR